MKNRIVSTKLGCACAMCIATIAGCSVEDVGTGSLTVAVQSEETITTGIASGDGLEDIADGWNVSFDKYLLTIGDIELAFASDGHVATEAPELHVVDLVQVPESGLPLWEFESLRAGRWQINYNIAGAASPSERHSSVEQIDFDRMLTDNLTYLIKGTLDAADGRSCPPPALASPGTAVASGINDAGDPCYANATVSMDLGVQAETFFGPCENDGVPGVSIPDGGIQTVSLTIHGDHMFFNGFPTGTEGGVMRLAQWFADCDLNLDGEVTQTELEAIGISDLSEIDDRYQLTNDLAGASMWQYLIGQLKTQGHINGEGECPVDGNLTI